MTEIDLDDLVLGPIDYLLIEYKDAQPTGEAIPYLLDLVDRGIVRLLDVAILAKSEDGTEVGVLDISQLPAFAELVGADSSLLDDDDIAEAGEALSPGAIGAILVYENTWAAPFATAVRKAGGQVVAGGRIPVNALLSALELDEEEI